MVKMLRGEGGKFTGRAPDPETDWMRPHCLVWERASADESPTRTAFRPAKTPTQLVRACQSCGKEFDALARVPDNYKLAQAAKYCSQTCARTAAKQRQRQRQREGVLGGVAGVVSRETVGWVHKVSREDAE